MKVQFLGNPAMRVAVVIPCYKVRKSILGVIRGMGAEVDRIVVVDDACPEATGAFVQSEIDDARVVVLFHQVNQGVGGAMITGWKHASDDCDLLVKMDGDGQMDPAYLSVLLAPLKEGLADYAKGNRFFGWNGLRSMPPIRLFGNAVLSLFSKISSGYWEVMDPTNGYVAIHAKVFEALDAERLAKRFFFESDLLHQLGIIRAVVFDVPIPAKYVDVESNLRISNLIGPFLVGHLRCTLQRIFVQYYLTGLTLGSLCLPSGLFGLLVGVIFGLSQWRISLATGVPATTGTVILAALPIILGTQLILQFLQQDLRSDRKSVV